MTYLFLDESGDHSLTRIDPQYPVFVLGGVVVDADYAAGEMARKLDRFKLDVLGTSDVTLHTATCPSAARAATGGLGVRVGTRGRQTPGREPQPDRRRSGICPGCGRLRLRHTPARCSSPRTRRGEGGDARPVGSHWTAGRGLTRPPRSASCRREDAPTASRPRRQ